MEIWVRVMKRQEEEEEKNLISVKYIHERPAFIIIRVHDNYYQLTSDVRKDNQLTSTATIIINWFFWFIDGASIEGYRDWSELGDSTKRAKELIELTECWISNNVCFCECVCVCSQLATREQLSESESAGQAQNGHLVWIELGAFTCVCEHSWVACRLRSRVNKREQTWEEKKKWSAKWR